jgi:hypothetical protein
LLLFTRFGISCPGCGSVRFGSTSYRYILIGIGWQYLVSIFFYLFIFYIYLNLSGSKHLLSLHFALISHHGLVFVHLSILTLDTFTNCFIIYIGDPDSVDEFATVLMHDWKELLLFCWVAERKCQRVFSSHLLITVHAK